MIGRTLGPLAAASLVLAACETDVPDEQVRREVAMLQQMGLAPRNAQIIDMYTMDGWWDGLEKRVELCVQTEPPPARCRKANLDLDYQKHDGVWRMIHPWRDPAAPSAEELWEGVVKSDAPAQHPSP